MYIYIYNYIWFIYLYNHLHVWSVFVGDFPPRMDPVPRPSWVFHLNVQLPSPQRAPRALSWRRVWCWETWWKCWWSWSHRGSNGIFIFKDGMFIDDLWYDIYIIWYDILIYIYIYTWYSINVNIKSICI